MRADFWWENLKEIIHLENKGVDANMILKCIWNNMAERAVDLCSIR